ncbi:MAG: ion transporter [Prolixibacteraceae bacterium]|nr:ion transporter [Prolixibacteraceae bacterium]MBT6004725.1 ion transporter [Prolixibacteraceae bacterium]MBT6766654.1 ion transporter [Prolixibacteraceae bacterium]MBT6997567.1 ion transporter [Prolixibacteraceae bacterium]MBT7394539.1 ion transporter [Prolixibacteraceae bacterium]
MFNSDKMSNTKKHLYELIFEADTREGKVFDISLLIVILIGVALVMLESVPTIRDNYQQFLKISEWIITMIFTLEYTLRILIVRKPFKYIFSFYGIIDLLSVIPTYLSLVIVGSQSLVVIRILRLLRIFRILKLTRYTQAGRTLANAMWASREKISVFVFFVIILVVIVGTIMYLIEGEEHGFTSIPRGIYWAIVTLTTVGYGDLSPVTALGQFLASIVMIMGYAIIAVPTGIVTAEIINPSSKSNTQVCPECLHDKHDDDSIYCKRCGSEINPEEEMYF